MNTEIKIKIEVKIERKTFCIKICSFLYSCTVRKF